MQRRKSLALSIPYQLCYIYESGKETIKRGNPLDLMQEYMEQWKTDYNPEYPPFQGGAIGYFSYDCIRICL